tara:strand:- start:14505 stop:15317 length:813 start_codon:yes stop_codon:yes gene_type:complete
MIGFNYLGKLGQLGNQMFQYAAVKGIAANKGYNYCIPNHKDVLVDTLGNKLKIELFNVFKMSNCSALNIQFIDQNRPSIEESGFHFNESIFNECPDWVNLFGFYQTEKYFKNIEDEIRQDFEFIDEYHKPCVEMIAGVENPVAIHIRRGDFLKNSGNHHNLSITYYEKALSMFDADRNVVIFSDDPQWCKDQKVFSDDRFLVSEGNSSYVDLCLMSLCSDFIIANSTFSWWGAWLANRGKVIAPSVWFGPNNAHLDIKDLYPEGWEVVDE